jgi:hypothetical protein
MQSSRLKRRGTTQASPPSNLDGPETPPPSMLQGSFGATERAAMEHGWWRVDSGWQA